LLLAGWLTLEHAWQPLSSLGIAEGGMIERLLAVNVGLILFNMLPAFPMDGGRVLRSLLAMKMDYARATKIAAKIGKGMALLFAIYGLFANPMLILIAFFVWSGASQEAASAQVKSAISGALVRDAMVTNFQVVSPSTTLQEMAALMLSGAQRDYPVMKRETMVGMLTHDDLLRAMQQHALDTPIVTFMRADVPTVNEDDLLDEVLARETGTDHSTSPVLKNGILVGLLTEENLHEYYIIRDAHRNLNFTWNRGARVVRDRTI
jgi:CBS domain-containing protein